MEPEGVSRKGSGSLRGPLATSLLLHAALLSLLALGLPRVMPEPGAALEVRLVSLETEDAGGLGGGEHSAQGSPTGAGAGSRPVAPPQAPPPVQPSPPPVRTRATPGPPLPVEGMKESAPEPSVATRSRFEPPAAPLASEEVIPRQPPAGMKGAAPAAGIESLPGGGLAGEEREAGGGAEGAFGEAKGGGVALGSAAGSPDGDAAGAGGPAGGGAFAEILRRIEAAKQYPEQARRFGHRGTVAVRFRIGRDGSVAAVEVAVSSGSPLLDAASLETVRRAAPLPPLPGWLRVRISYGLAEARP